MTSPAAAAGNGLVCECFVSGHDFSRAVRSFSFLNPSGFSPRGVCFFDVFRSLSSHAVRVENRNSGFSPVGTSQERIDHADLIFSVLSVFSVVKTSRQALRDPLMQALALHAVERLI